MDLKRIAQKIDSANKVVFYGVLVNIFKAL